MPLGTSYGGKCWTLGRSDSCLIGLKCIGIHWNEWVKYRAGGWPQSVPKKRAEKEGNLFEFYWTREKGVICGKSSGCFETELMELIGWHRLAAVPHKCL
jgi:hypothetical protein